MLKPKRGLLKALCVALCCIFTVSLTACTPKDGTDGGKTAANITVWTARGTERIRKNDDHSDRYDDKTLTINAFRDEYESAQIILSADGNVNEYTVETADLKSDGGATLSKDAFTVYNQKYIQLTTIKSPGWTGGWYPDALLPWEKAVEYKENTIKLESTESVVNQGVWITVKPSATQAAGVYGGSFKVTADGNEFSVPVSVRVFDYTLDEEVHSKSKISYSVNGIQIFELDASVEMFETYYEFMLDYRITPGGLPCGDATKYASGNDAYYDYIVKYNDDPRVTLLPLAFTGGADYVKVNPNSENEAIAVDMDGVLAVSNRQYVAVVKDGKITLEDFDANNAEQAAAIAELDNYETVYIPCIYWSTMENMLKKIANRAVKESTDGKLCDLFKKLSMYCTIFDEFRGQSGENKAVYNLKMFTALKNRVAEWIESSLENTNPELSNEKFAELKSKLIPSLLKISNTSPVDNNFSSFVDNNIESFSSCPTVDTGYVDEGVGIKEFVNKHGGEAWVYTAVNPKTPYPTYHIEDYLLSSRLLSWMMSEYDIVGNLFWATTLAQYTEGSMCNIEDLYSEPLRFGGANGDGFWLYPGRPYGIKGPVGSIRLMSVRDGSEDFDLLYALEQFMINRGIEETDRNGVMHFLYDGLYKNAICKYDDGYLDRFDRARINLGNMLELAENAGVVLESYAIAGSDAKFVVSAPTSTTLNVNGTVTEGGNKTVGDSVFKTYTVTVPLNLDSNKLTLSATANGKSYSLELNLGGRYEEVAAASFTDKIKVTSNTGNTASVTAAELGGEAAVAIAFEATEVSAAKVDAAVSSGKTTVEVYTADVDLSAFITTKLSKVVVKIYYDKDDEPTLTLRRPSGRAYVDVVTVTLKNGWNEIEIDSSAFNNVLSGLRLVLGTHAESLVGGGTAPATTLGLGKIALIGESKQ